MPISDSCSDVDRPALHHKYAGVTDLKYTIINYYNFMICMLYRDMRERKKLDGIYTLSHV